MAEAGAVKNIRSAGTAKPLIDEIETGQDGCFKERDRNNNASKKFSDDQNFFSDWNEKLIVESACDHFTTEQPSKNAHAGEEDAEADVVELDDAGEDLSVFREVHAGRGTVGLGDGMEDVVNTNE